MFRALKNAHKLSKVATKWASITGIDIRDSGQVVRKASDYVDNLNLSPQDAWTMSLTNWIIGMPWPDSQLLLSKGLIQFLDRSGSPLQISDEVAVSARKTALAIISRGSSSFEFPTDI